MGQFVTVLEYDRRAHALFALLRMTAVSMKDWGSGWAAQTPGFQPTTAGHHRDSHEAGIHSASSLIDRALCSRKTDEMHMRIYMCTWTHTRTHYGPCLCGYICWNYGQNCWPPSDQIGSTQSPFPLTPPYQVKLCPVRSGKIKNSWSCTYKWQR